MNKHNIVKYIVFPFLLLSILFALSSCTAKQNNVTLLSSNSSDSDDKISGTPITEVDTDGDGIPDKTLVVPDALDPNIAVVPDN